MRIQTEVSALAPRATAAMLFDRVADPAKAPKFFRGYGPIPAIASIRPLTPGPTTAGSEREVVLADGGTLHEQVLEFAPPRLHRYQIASYGPPLAKLFRSSVGLWTFTPEGAGARVAWRYDYELRSVWVWPLAALFVKGLMRGAMRRAVAELARTSSADVPKTSG